MVRALELDADSHARLAAHCKQRGIQFLSTPFDVPSVGLLQTLGVPLLKVPSGEITNPLLLRAVAATGLPLIVSTGMSTLGEVEAALALLAAAWLGRADAFASDDGQRLLHERVTLLHCTTEYPAPYDEVNLRAMATMQSAFGLRVGFSDHTPGTTIAVAAVALGAVVIEKHFTLSKEGYGPDAALALEPDELEDLVEGIREIETMLANPIDKDDLEPFAEMKRVFEKSVVAVAPIPAGGTIERAMLAAKKPGTGIPAARLDDVVGRVARADIAADTVVTEEMLA
jgi:N-acetylneuraminate synthase